MTFLLKELKKNLNNTDDIETYKAKQITKLLIDKLDSSLKLYLLLISIDADYVHHEFVDCKEKYEDEDCNFNYRENEECVILSFKKSNKIHLVDPPTMYQRLFEVSSDGSTTLDQFLGEVSRKSDKTYINEGIVKLSKILEMNDYKLFKLLIASMKLNKKIYLVGHSLGGISSLYIHIILRCLFEYKNLETYIYGGLPIIPTNLSKVLNTVYYIINSSDPICFSNGKSTTNTKFENLSLPNKSNVYTLSKKILSREIHTPDPDNPSSIHYTHNVFQYALALQKIILMELKIPDEKIYYISQFLIYDIINATYNNRIIREIYFSYLKKILEKYNYSNTDGIKYEDLRNGEEYKYPHKMREQLKEKIYKRIGLILREEEDYKSYLTELQKGGVVVNPGGKDLLLYNKYRDDIYKFLDKKYMEKKEERIALFKRMNTEEMKTKEMNTEEMKTKKRQYDTIINTEMINVTELISNLEVLREKIESTYKTNKTSVLFLAINNYMQPNENSLDYICEKNEVDDLLASVHKSIYTPTSAGRNDEFYY